MATRPKLVPNVIPALTARTQLGQILKRVRQNSERFVVDRRGEPQAMIISIEEYLRHFVRTPAALKRIRRIAKAKHLDSTPLRIITREIKKYRRERRAGND